MRITIGLAFIQGVIPGSATFDFLVPMARSVRDLVSLLDVILDEPKPQPIIRCYAATESLHFQSFISFSLVILNFTGSPALQQR